jgi:hypothetical protein
MYNEPFNRTERTMIINQVKRIHAIVAVSIDFEVDETEFSNLVASGLSAEDALEELRSNGCAKSISYDSEVQEELAVYESEISL